jgi:hypothetical protein
MTAEIAILNKNGVALAADSKVTIGAAGQEKTFDTVNKLFTLSKAHPVGVMIFGNAEFMGYPWETIVKLYRQKKGGRAEQTIAAWGASFLKYLSEFGDIRDSDKSRNTRTVIGSVFEELHDEVFAQARREEIAIPSVDYVNLLKKRVELAISVLQSETEYFDDQQRNAFVEEYAIDIGTVVGEFFQSFDDTDLTAKAGELALYSAFKKTFSPQSSGFVIAGFGDREYFPALVPHLTDGYVGDVLKVARG